MGLNGKSTTYSDLFIESVHPVSKGVNAGINACYDHWFGGKQHNWWLAGPIAYFPDLLGKGFTPYVRYAYEQDIVQGQRSTHANDFRIGLKVTF